MAKSEESKKSPPKSSEEEKNELKEMKQVVEPLEGRGPLGEGNGQAPEQKISVSLRRTEVEETEDQFFWAAIRNRTKAIRFDAYNDFIKAVICDPVKDSSKGDKVTKLNIPDNARLNDARLIRQINELYTPLHGIGAYELLKTATQVFLLLEAGLCPAEIKVWGTPGKEKFYNLHEHDRFPPEHLLFDKKDEAIRFGKPIEFRVLPGLLATYLGDNRLPYIQTVINNAFQGITEDDSVFCSGFLTSRADCPPLIELIWSYWHEEAMLIQSMNAISLRFQNRRRAAVHDPLAHLEIAPLFPVNNLLWGYIQDEHQRLSVPRRAYEYNHHYGLTLAGKAIPDFQPAETRSKFLEAFHHLLNQAGIFFKQDDDVTFNADGFPVLNALKEVHLLLAEGQHNQFGDLPWTARAEMLMEQWILSRPEMSEFLQSRKMIPYREGWMGPVDTMKRLQGWTDVSVTYFNELAIFGEQLLLSVRYGNWNLENNPANAANWARSWRPEIQNYIHSYRAVTGVDLGANLTTIQQRKLLSKLPTVLIRERLQSGKSTPALPPPMPNTVSRSFRERQMARRTNGTSK